MFNFLDAAPFIPSLIEEFWYIGVGGLVVIAAIIVAAILIPRAVKNKKNK